MNKDQQTAELVHI